MKPVKSFQQRAAEQQQTLKELDWLASLDKVLDDLCMKAVLCCRGRETIRWAEQVRVVRDNYKFSAFRAKKPNPETCAHHRFRLLTLLGSRPALS